MAVSTTANQIDLNNLTVGSLLIPGREETPSHPSSVTESWHDGVCWTRSGPAVSSSHPGSLTSHSKTRGLTSQLNSTCIAGSMSISVYCLLNYLEGDLLSHALSTTMVILSSKMQEY